MTNVLSSMLAQQGWSRVLFRIGQTDVTTSRAVTAASVVILSLLLARLLGSLLNRMVERKTRGVSRSSLRSSIRLLQYALMVGGLLLGLQIIGIQLAALFAAGALLAVALGFAMQSVVSNFISGVILLLERSIKPGDIIEIGDQIVEIREMGIRAAIGRTLNEEDLIIPSSQLVESTVRNYTLRDPVSRLRVLVGVSYGSDMALVRKTLEQTAEAIEWRIQKMQPVILMRAFGSSSVDFEVSVWYDDPWNRNRRSSDLHEAIWFALKDAGITIAFPQVDVHFDEAAIGVLGRGSS
jgi:small-conductance mechanosensitive channel